MNIKFKIIYALIGIVLIILYFITGSYGLTERNISICENALKLQGSINKIGFYDFNISDYPISLYDGKSDYVYNNGTIKSREPVLDTFVGTAYKVNDHYEIIVPTIEKFSDMVSLFNGFSDVLNNKNSYGDKEHIATIWHEGFHAYQMTKFKNNIDTILPDYDDEKSLESYIVSNIDQNDAIVDYYNKELKLLKNAVLTNDINEVKKCILEYKKLDDDRKKLLNNNIIKIEDYLELVEGTAYYVESNVYKLLYNEEKYYENYIKNLDLYTNGSSKYYHMGMAKALILDKISPDWKSKLDFSKTLSEILYDEIEV